MLRLSLVTMNCPAFQEPISMAIFLLNHRIYRAAQSRDVMDGYSEPCGQCGSVFWGVSDGGQFFCKNCHNVIERTKDCDDMNTVLSNSRISSLSTRKRKQSGKGARDWMVCEGFQLIIKLQAEALVKLGVCPQFKDLSSNSEAESSVAFSEVSSHAEVAVMNGVSAVSGYSSDGRSSVCSGSVDAQHYLRQKERGKLMSMPRTLAFCHLALLWVREAITLADLLRLVSKGHIPYVNVHEFFPEEMRFFGKDALIFRVETIPTYSKVHKEAVELAALIDLPTFPPVSQDCLLHPALLSLRYLMDANLPDELHTLVCKVIQKTAMGNDSFLTFDPNGRKPTLLCYDLQAAALIVVTMKLLFRLDDKVEWKLARKADKKGDEMDHGKKKTKRDDNSSVSGGKMFNLRTWFMIVQPALERAREKEKQAEAMRQWKSKKPIIPSSKHKTVILKRRHVWSVSQKPDSLSRVWVVGAHAHDRYPKHMAPDPYAPSCGWWAYGKVGLRLFFGLCPAESCRQRLGHQALACVTQPQAWLQGGAPVTPVRVT
ncbi:hypothetical protein QTP70_006366 [Hemibagrus guttatus]|uniref:TATA box-binding protein-associated factor RNA polymerase I subunit B n=1 Tax=Hemibagrus guttatus TaxID=175788 RepID=A0AAE0Q9E7_9TELE|nr:hypothetical protein QTP70_006366 [Hemibagrus guttatus]